MAIPLYLWGTAPGTSMDITIHGCLSCMYKMVCYVLQVVLSLISHTASVLSSVLI